MLCHSHVMVGSSTATRLDIVAMCSVLFFVLLVGRIYYIVIRVDVLDKWSVITNMCSTLEW